MTRPGVRYIVFMDDLLDMLPQINNRQISGEFIVVRHGRNFGIRLKTAENQRREIWHDRELIIPQYI